MFLLVRAMYVVNGFVGVRVFESKEIRERVGSEGLGMEYAHISIY